MTSLVDYLNKTPLLFLIKRSIMEKNLVCKLGTTGLVWLFLQFECQATSVVTNGVSIKSNQTESVAYCALAFSSDTNKIHSAASLKVLEAYYKIVEAKSAEMARDYVLQSDMYTIEEFINKRNIDILLGKLKLFLGLVLKDASYEGLNAVDNCLREQIDSARLVSKLCYDTEYENMLTKMSANQLSAFIVILAYNKTKANTLFVQEMQKCVVSQEKRNNEK
jgi:hypothetical protein